MAEGLKLDSGIYRIKIVRPDDLGSIGGEYATGQVPQRPVKAFADRPPFSENQIWEVIVNKSNDTGIIKWLPPADEPKEFWSYRQRKDHEPIILDQPKEFSFISVGPNYIIRAVRDGPVGVDYDVGVSEDQTLVLQSVPVNVSIESRPLWQFRAVRPAN